jgi:4-oxalocrotonate tautomerase
MPEIVVHAVEGRSAEAKRALMKDISDAVVRHFGVPIESVVVTIAEAPKADKMKGGVLFSERAPAKPAAT